MRPSSRDIKDLHHELARRWLVMLAEFKRLYPNDDQPFLTQTYRNQADQAADYAKGRTAPGPVVTNAKFGQSLHNFYPALAFDVAFREADGGAEWNEAEYVKLAQIAHECGLGWGGDWHHSKDRPHFEPPNFTWEMAAAGTEPTFGPITIGDQPINNGTDIGGACV